MDDLATRMRAAADAPPPSRIDLDALISGELRRRRTLRWAGGAAAVAAAVTLAISVPTVFLPGSGGDPRGSALGPGTTGTAAPSLCAPLRPSLTSPQPPLQTYDTVRARPTEPVDQAVPRLTGALRAALQNVLPAGMTVESLQEGCAEPQFQYHPRYRRYDLIAQINDQRGSGTLVVEIMASGAGGAQRCPFSNDPADCIRTEDPDGTIAFTATFPRMGGTGRQYEVLVERPDGITVWLNSSNVTFARDQPERLTRPEPPLTVEQLIRIARAPGLTLYP